jgi:hypothetical protein
MGGRFKVRSILTAYFNLWLKVYNLLLKNSA